MLNFFLNFAIIPRHPDEIEIFFSIEGPVYCTWLMPRMLKTCDTRSQSMSNHAIDIIFPNISEGVGFQVKQSTKIIDLITILYLAYNTWIDTMLDSIHSLWAYCFPGVINHTYSSSFLYILQQCWLLHLWPSSAIACVVRLHVDQLQ